MVAEKRKTKSVVKKKAPVSNTGGMGFSFENSVAARFMLDLLGQTNTLGVEGFGKVVRLDWQARDSEWLLDDLVVTSQAPIGRRSAAISIKSGQKVTPVGFPAEFVGAAWSQWFGIGVKRIFANTADVVVLATGQGTHAARAPWERLLRETLAASSDRIVARLSHNNDDGQQTSKEERAIFASFACPAEYEERHTVETETVDLIRQVRWLDFDYDSPTSQSYAAAFAASKAILIDTEASRAQELWERLQGIADGKRKTGATIDLPGLLAELRGKFRLKDNPDYAGDWAALKARTDAELEGIKTNIAGLPRLERKADLQSIADAVMTRGACFLVGDSGCGKSALAKEFAGGYSWIIWASGNMLEHASLPDFEKAIGLSHGLAEIIDATPESVLIVLDAIEGYSQRARKVAMQLFNAARSTAAAKRVHLIITAQAEAARTLAVDLVSAGFPHDLLEITPLARPAEREVRAMMTGLPKVGWIALNREVRSLLTNLKMLDWFVLFAQSGGTIDTANVGLTNLIDSLWGHWVESGADKFARSHLLKLIATFEADQHVGAVPMSALGHAEQVTLGKVSDGELLRVRNQRIQFAHDLLSDWSRLKVLIGEDWLATRERYSSPKWFRAIRLYGQWLLEQSGDHGDTWQKRLEEVDDGTPTGTLVRDLFLEALFLAPNADALLRQTWPVLAANRAKLLKVLIERFLYVATIPDPLLLVMLGKDQDANKYEHLLRYPYWPYWGPLVSLLNEKSEETAKLAPNEAAKVCALWLRSMNFSPKIVWRNEAAELAYAIAYEAYAQDAVREPFAYAGSKIIYEALLLAAAELPAEVGQLCLELTTRRALDPVIARRAAEAQAKRAEEQKKTDAETSRRRRSLPHPISPLGRLRKPWPDGPRQRVEHEFVEACLDRNAYGVFAKANADAALEVLLAVCIEAPQHETYGSSLRDDLGLNYWRSGDAAIWFRGPFLALLNAAPDHGLTFVIRLTNFVTQRYVRGHDESVTFSIGGRKRRWLGDSNVFTWHYDGHLTHGTILQCSLMALEKWLYDRLDAGEDISPVVTRIMNESESLAFAGLLFTVAKKQPQLLVGPLGPLLEAWEVVEWDLQLTNARNLGHRGFIGFWGFQPQEAIKIAQDWVGMEHRTKAVRNLLATEFVPSGAYDKLFKRLRTVWKKHLTADRKPIELRRLIESLRRSNYKYDLVDGKKVPIGFKQSPKYEAEDTAISKEASKTLQFMTLPFRCRKMLDERTQLNDNEIEPFAIFFKSINKKADQDDDSLHTKKDVVLAGVAVLVCLHYDWLAANPTRLAWCRDRLEHALNTPAERPRFYSDTNLENDSWDAFAAECGVSLLARDRTDPLARKLVAQGITAFFYSTTQLVMGRAADASAALSDDFKRIVAAITEWSSIRPLLNITPPQFTAEINEWSKRKAALENKFIDGTLSPALPNLSKTSGDARQEIDRIHEKQFPAQTAFRKSGVRRRTGSGSRAELYPEHPGFDTRLVGTAFSWLRPDAITPFSRADTIRIIKEVLDLVIAGVPKIKDRKAEEIRGLPSDFDGSVFEIVAAAIPLLTPAEKPETLWKPILSLGAPAHEWVERFYWQWFTISPKAAPDLTNFFYAWRRMIEFALASAEWDHKTNWHHQMDSIVYELLGFNANWSSWIRADGARAHIDAMNDLYERAAAKWFSLPKVLSGFVHRAQHEAMSTIAINSIPWIAAAVRDYSDYDWRYGTEEALIEFLGVFWQRDARQITLNTGLRTAFFELVKILVARGSHAALALQDRVSHQTVV